MPDPSTAPRYLLRWDFAREASIQHDVVMTTHRLAELPLGSDQRLRQMLRQTPRNAIAINTMGRVVAHPSEWQTGSLGNLRADEAIELIQRERLWVTAGNMDVHHQQIAAALARLVAELSECHVGLRIRDAHVDLVISSPTAFRYYGVDPTPTVLWHLAGRSRIWLYPATKEFIDPRCLQHSVDRQPQTLYYEPAFDQQARVIDVEPGQMIAWPHWTPYRIENLAGLNVSLRMSYQTPQSMRSMNIQYARQLLGGSLLHRVARETHHGLTASLMNLIGGRLRSHRDRLADLPENDTPTFCLDQHDLGNQSAAPVIAPLTNKLLITPSAAVVSES